MNVCDRTFELVDSHLDAIGYTGPIALSCDDTKLFPAWRIYWDAKEESYFLVGGTGEPMRVADPDHLRAVIESANLVQAPKVFIQFYPTISYVCSSHLGTIDRRPGADVQSCTCYCCSYPNIG